MRHIVSALAITVPLACSEAPRVTQPAAARTVVNEATRYRVDTLPTLGGRLNRASGINNAGDVAGFANLPGDTIRHAVLWRNGILTDLETLGGENSNVQWPGISNSGLIAGISEINQPDTLHEEWSCTAFLPRITGQ